MNKEQIEKSYNLAKAKYGTFGVNVDVGDK